MGVGVGRRGIKGGRGSGEGGRMGGGSEGVKKGGCWKDVMSFFMQA